MDDSSDDSRLSLLLIVVVLWLFSSSLVVVVGIDGDEKADKGCCPTLMLMLDKLDGGDELFECCC